MFNTEMRNNDNKMKILIVEDEKPLAEILQIALTQEGFSVNMVNSGEEAEKLATNILFDVILLDRYLPEKDGLLVCQDFRQQQIWTPVIMLTRKTTKADIVEALESGADDYLVKPFHLGELLARIRSVLRRSVGCYN
jgi:DNA-binding response OmpR family regulator